MIISFLLNERTRRDGLYHKASNFRIAIRTTNVKNLHSRSQIRTLPTRVQNLFSLSIGKAFVTTSVQPFEKDWQHNHGHKEDNLKKSSRDWMKAPGERPSSHNPYENGEGENNKPRRGFHALTLSLPARGLEQQAYLSV